MLLLHMLVNLGQLADMVRPILGVVLIVAFWYTSFDRIRVITALEYTLAFKQEQLLHTQDMVLRCANEINALLETLEDAKHAYHYYQNQYHMQCVLTKNIIKRNQALAERLAQLS